jgi:hypothetical protein
MYDGEAENEEAPPMEILRVAAVSGFALWLAACASLPHPPLNVPPRDCPGTSEVTDAVFLIGDAGAVAVSNRGGTDEVELVDPVLLDLAGDVVAASSALGADRTSVVFLGDNIYSRGLQDEGQRGREHGLRVLDAQAASIGPAKGYFIAGNHDWDLQGPRGWDYAVNQSRYFEKRGPRIAMIPPGGCAGPFRADIGDHLRLIFLDIIGWSHAFQFPEQHRPRCGHQTAFDTYYALADEFDHPDGRHVALLTHHPIITTGPHGGHFTWKEHLFPLRDVLGPSWWVPLPIIGSIYPIARLLGVTGTDVSSEVYQRYIRAIDKTSRPGVPMLIAAGHEHSLQLHRDPSGTFYAVSGAGSTSKVNRVREAESLLMGVAEPGYMRLDLHADGSLQLTVFALHRGERRRPVYRACLAEGPPRVGRRLPSPAEETRAPE